MKIGRIAWILIAVSAGLAAGGGGFTFIYAKGGSYLTNDPQACANCHIMQEQYDGWINSSHRSVATCNDCHTPSGLIPKYFTKAENGWRHSWAFTTGNYPEHIRQIPRSRRITEQACRKCHSTVVEAIEGPHHADSSLSCIRCHRSVGHLH
jgi:cytochrome c nitrite reductase small subunit